jgi:hypothetical protein
MKLTNEKRYVKWLDAVKIDHNALLDVPKELWTDELCLEAVKTDYSILHSLPKERLTKEICITAYQKSHGGAIRYVPADLREIYWGHVKGDTKY